MPEALLPALAALAIGSAVALAVRRRPQEIARWMRQAATHLDGRSAMVVDVRAYQGAFPAVTAADLDVTLGELWPEIFLRAERAAAMRQEMARALKRLPQPLRRTRA